jgi:hypothetical protein
MKPYQMMAFMIMSVGLWGPSAASAQNQSMIAPKLAFCDPLLSKDVEDLDKDDGDDDVLTQIRRYDLEQAEQLTTPQQIMDAIFEETWNLDTNAPIARNELCSAEESYVVLWTKLLREADNGNYLLDAEGYMAFRKDKSFEFVFADRPYSGNWELDDTDMVLTADWLNDGEPYSAPVERVETPVETTFKDGRTNSFTEETFRIGGFSFYRLPTTVKGAVRDCACANQDN